MVYYKTSLYVNTDLNDVISEKLNGLVKEFLATDLNKKNDYIIYLAGNLKEKLNTNVFINTKFKYSFRNIRFEIVFCIGDTIFLVKTIKDRTKFDKEALKLDVLIDEIQLLSPTRKFVGCFIVNDKDFYINIFKNTKVLLQNKFIMITENDILFNDNLENYVLSD